MFMLILEFKKQKKKKISLFIELELSNIFFKLHKHVFWFSNNTSMCCNDSTQLETEYYVLTLRDKTEMKMYSMGKTMLKLQIRMHKLVFFFRIFTLVHDRSN